MNAHATVTLAEPPELDASNPRPPDRVASPADGPAHEEPSNGAVPTRRVELDPGAINSHGHAERRSPFAPKLTVAQRRAAVRMRREGGSWNAVAQCFAVSPTNVQYLVRCGRYDARPVAEPVSQVRVTTPVPQTIGDITDGGRRAARAGVDLIIHSLPLEHHRTLERLAGEAGWSVADFARELLACAAPPTSAEPAAVVRRVGLRHLVSTWESPR